MLILCQARLKYVQVRHFQFIEKYGRVSYKNTVETLVYKQRHIMTSHPFQNEIKFKLSLTHLTIIFEARYTIIKVSCYVLPKYAFKLQQIYM